jgi:hypothetical protein
VKLPSSGPMTSASVTKARGREDGCEEEPEIETTDAVGGVHK